MVFIKIEYFTKEPGLSLSTSLVFLGLILSLYPLFSIINLQTKTKKRRIHMNNITQLLNLEDSDIFISDINIQGTTKTLTLETKLYAHCWCVSRSYGNICFYCQPLSCFWHIRTWSFWPLLKKFRQRDRESLNKNSLMKIKDMFPFHSQTKYIFFKNTAGSFW